MAAWCYAGLAFLVAALLSSIELITAKYPRTWFLLRKCKSLWFYALIYGCIGGAAMFWLKDLVAGGKVQLQGLFLSAPWFQAVAIGISVKSLLHINLFNITKNGQSVPIGLETITQLFEPHLLRGVMFDEFNAVRSFVQPFQQAYPNLTDVRTTLSNNVPNTLPQPEIEAFRADLDKAVNVQEAMERGLRFRS